jgi:hypothetical protein
VIVAAVLAVACIPYVNPDTLPTGGPGFSTVRIQPTTEQPGASDGTGAFRTVCDFSHMNFDDPIVYPGQPGKAHLHAYFGNTGADASSTAASLRSTGSSTCRGGIANRSAYWVPSIVDTRTGNAVAPDEIVVYYKSGYGGVVPSTIRPMPSGLRIIAGDMAAAAPQAHVRWECEDVGYSPSTQSHIHGCAPGDRVLMMIEFPQCWDGVNLDSANHKSHMAYPTGSGCPATHPVGLPVITYNVYTEVGPGQDATRWKLSSDSYDAAQPGGYSAHGDWFDGWDPNIVKAWVENCDSKAMDCHAHLLGDGRELY